MAQAQSASTAQKRSEAGKKGAATRAAKQAEAQGKTLGPTGKVMPDAAPNDVPVEQRKGERRQAERNLAEQFQPTEQQNLAAHEQPGQPGQQPAPEPQPSEEEMKAKAFADAIKALAATMGVDPATVLAPQQPANAQPAQTAQQAQRQTRNNITRPASNTITGSIWDLADKLSAAKNGQGFAAIAELRADKSMKDVNEATLKTQYARWRSYHGLKGRQDAAPQAPAETPTGQQAPNQGASQPEGEDHPMRRKEDQPAPEQA